jgi:hypothetical protein
MRCVLKASKINAFSALFQRSRGPRVVPQAARNSHVQSKELFLEFVGGGRSARMQNLRQDVGGGSGQVQAGIKYEANASLRESQEDDAADRASRSARVALGSKAVFTSERACVYVMAGAGFQPVCRSKSAQSTAAAVKLYGTCASASSSGGGGGMA